MALCGCVLYRFTGNLVDCFPNQEKIEKTRAHIPKDPNVVYSQAVGAMLVHVGMWIYAVVTFEETLRSNVLSPDEFEWSFGQVLAMVILIGPLFDLIMSLVGKDEGTKEEGHEMQTLLTGGASRDTEAGPSADTNATTHAVAIAPAVTQTNRANMGLMHTCMFAAARLLTLSLAGGGHRCTPRRVVFPLWSHYSCCWIELHGSGSNVVHATIRSHCGSSCIRPSCLCTLCRNIGDC